MKRKFSSMTQEEFVADAQKRMKRVFGGLDRREEIYEGAKSNYFYFSGMYHIRSGLVTPSVVNDLRNGKTLLSVGCGDAHLERFLSKGYEIPSSRITLTDKSLDECVQTFGSTFYQFDMTKPWPIIGNYDYILFPESLGVALLESERGKPASSPVAQRFDDIAKRITRAVYDNRIQDITNGERAFFFTLLEREVGRVVPTHTIINEAFRHLTPGGELRVSRSGGIQSDQQTAYVILKLLLEHTLTYSLSPGPFVVRKS